MKNKREREREREREMLCSQYFLQYFYNKSQVEGCYKLLLMAKKNNFSSRFKFEQVTT